MIKRIKRKINFVLRSNFSTDLALPDFIIIGAQKGGTTSLYEYLIQHPKISGSIAKEVHYYDANYEKGLNWYKAHFHPSITNTIKGEATPYYLFHPKVPYRIREDSKNIKFIVLLRNPVDRAYSHYKMMVKRGIEPLSFENAIDEEDNRIHHEFEALNKGEIDHSSLVQDFSYISRGIYVSQLERWMTLFPKENFLILNSENFYENTESHMRKIEEFIGVNKWENYSFEVHNSGNPGNKMNVVTEKKLESFFAPFNEELYKLIGENYNW
ncbi:sulfotransferase domain-containing protein [Virgibacillus doumboii]|uniref:sulfotransferase domain-containing protein n=1 Tax=Virgibacillus doumboii TaxID=2697503 RepID=UPI0013DF761F|nr:sulfotransferase domain-containing protein [Virgibacillus doumboii]